MFTLTITRVFIPNFVLVRTELEFILLVLLIEASASSVACAVSTVASVAAVTSVITLWITPFHFQLLASAFACFFIPELSFFTVRVLAVHTAGTCVSTNAVRPVPLFGWAFFHEEFALWVSNAVAILKNF